MTAIVIILILVLWTVLGFAVALRNILRGKKYGKDTTRAERIAVLPVTVIVWLYDSYRRYIRR